MTGGTGFARGFSPRLPALLREERLLWPLAYGALLGVTFLLRGKLSGNLALVCFILPVLLQAGAERAALAAARPVAHTAAFLAGVGLWAVLSCVANRVPFGATVEAATSLLLLVLFLGFVHGLVRRVPFRRVLLVLAGFAALNALLSMLVHVAQQGWVFSRLIPLGRPGNPIPAAGGIAIGLVALLALAADRPRPSPRAWALAGLALAAMLAALVWTQSRGPIIAFGAAVAAMAVLARTTARPAPVLAACLLAWAVVTGAILLEGSVRGHLCALSQGLCRPSLRGEVWAWVWETVRTRPLLGTSPAFRFPDQMLNHPHNGVFGTAMFYGPLLLAAGLVALALLLRRLPRLAPPQRAFVVGGLVFAFGYMGSDLSNPFAFFNMHYLFLWLPVFCLASLPEAETAARVP